jgi:phosphatidylinositol kinase/protein kinase (PI-3  family)
MLFLHPIQYPLDTVRRITSLIRDSTKNTWHVIAEGVGLRNYFTDKMSRGNEKLLYDMLHDIFGDSIQE